MLVLTRKKDQSIVINENIEITILDVQGDQVRVGIRAPKNISVHRKEIFLQIAEENKKAASINMGINLNEILKKSES
ncbi:MAG: carbon storage regulator CsrA [Bacillota bacterium]